MKPLEAGFDGAKGVSLGEPDVLYNLMRGKTPPKDCPNTNFKNQLCWYYPDEENTKLLYCNSDGDWFELTFEPINIATLD